MNIRRVCRSRSAPILACLIGLLCLLLSAGCGKEEKASSSHRGHPPARSQSPLAEKSPLERGGGALSGGQAISSPGGSSASSDSTYQNAPNVAGQWSGRITDTTGKQARLQFAFTGEGADLQASGLMATDQQSVRVEPLTGSIDETGNLALTYTSPDGSVTWKFFGTLKDDSISGESTFVNRRQQGSSRPDHATFFLGR